MTRSCFLVAVLLAVAMGSKLSLAARESSGGGGDDIPTNLGRELRELISKANDFLGTAARRVGADGWHTTATANADAMRASLRSSTARRSRRARKSGAANCIPVDMCRKKKVFCGKRCYRSSSAGSSLNHIPTTKCVVKCKKCVPTC